ncbi:restriction endonuclease subunit S [Bacillus sp. FSL K6-0993]|uniref:restriction endonuclease subunit S n=1 Tax=Bacillus sp. FSL K6-0993 TaxID=2921456 RepID=UPI0030ED4B3B
MKIKLKYISRINMGQSPDQESVNQEGVGTPFLQGKAEFGESHPTPVNYCVKANKFSMPNDILMSVRAPVGSLNFSDQKYVIGRGLCSITPKDGLDRDYLWYGLIEANSRLLTLVKGSTFEAVTTEDVKNLEIEIPSNFEEQQRISKLLSKKDKEISDLIVSKNKLINLLEQQRQSIITEAVTKGLNSNVKMKDSGVEWIGEIPEHWTVNKIKRIVDILTCGYASTPTYVDESKGVPFLSAQNVSRSGKLKLEKYNYISQELHNSLTKYKKPMKGDILQVRVGAGIGQTCIVDVDFDFSIYVSLSHIRVKKFIHNKYLTYILGSRNFNEYANMQTLQAGGVGNLNVSDLEKSKIPYPSLKEQIEIASYLEVECSKIDNLVESINKQIEKLKEYRQALIYEAVTGKIDVRDMELD